MTLVTGSRDRHAHVWHAVTFGVAAFALVLQFVLVVQGVRPLAGAELETGAWTDLGTRLIRFFSFLTIWFNLMIAGTTAVLAIDPTHDGRVWRALRLDAVVIGVVGGVVHWFLLRPILDLHGANYVADKLLHIATPSLTLIGWLLFGPRGRIEVRDLFAFLVAPLVWLAYTLIRGAITGWYPYPFIDVGKHGYAVVGLVCLTITSTMITLAIAGMWLDRRLASVAIATPASEEVK
jgi:hypothetical protein